MKQLILAIGLYVLALPLALAQGQAPHTAFADSINRVFQYLDKSRVPSGILEEYGLQFIDHAPFTGIDGYSAANQLDVNRWRALYGDLYGARLHAAAHLLPSLATVNQRLAAYAHDDYVELPVLHLDYHSIHPDALGSGRLRSVGNRLYDVPGTVVRRQLQVTRR